MNRFRILLLIVTLFQLQVKAQDTAILKQVFEQSPVLKDYFFGFSLYDLDQNRFLIGIDEGKYFTPASNTKVFTLFASLKHIGDSIPGIHYVERGDSLIFWGTGDPTFLHSKLDSHRVYNFLKNTSKKLYYAEERNVEEPFYRHGWAIDDYDEYYQPELSTFPIYGNVTTFRAEGGKLKVTPQYFEKQISIKEKGESKFGVQRDFNQNRYVLNGTVIPNNYINEKPFKYSTEVFIDLLQDTLGKAVEVVQVEKPQNHQVLYSTSTREVLREMMLPSDNFLAEQLNMVASINQYGEFKTAQLRKDMEEGYYKYFTDKIALRDGSGLSAYNKVTPRSMVELLLMVQQEIPDETALHYLFPTGGVDGTLKSAYSLDGGEAFVWAKTGTISGVHNQSGFIRTRTGRRLVFSFMNNNFLGSATLARKEMVRIMTFIREKL